MNEAVSLQAVEDSTLLVVDDEPANVVLLERILAGAGFHDVHSLLDPREAEDTYVSLDPDLVLLDVNMPFVDGFELLDRLGRHVEPADYRPIIMLTADAQPETRIRALSQGAQDFVLKPFLAEEVLLRVRNLLWRRHVHRSQLDHGRHLADTVLSRTESLKEERRYLRALLDCVDVGIVACDASGRLRLANRTLRSLGFDPDEAGPLGTLPADRLRLNDGTALRPEDEPLRLAIAGREVDGLELRFEDREGNERVLLVNARPIRDDSQGDGTGEETPVLGAVAAIHEISERRRVEDELRRLALHDALTGLPNRTLLMDRLSVALARIERVRRALAVLFVDVDDFKLINDTMGHAVGDRVLHATADRLRQSLREGDTAARFGGDEFVVLCEDLDDAADGPRIAERLRRLVGEPILVDGVEIRPRISIGVAVAQDFGRTGTELLRDADTAMLRAKRLGGARHEVFDQALREHLLQQVDLEASLIVALERSELEVHFQPTIDLTTGQVRGAEALVRWHRGEQWVSPEVFIPVAERSGLIVRIGEFVLRTACERLAAWLAEGLLSDDFVLAVNIAPRQVSQPGFAEQIDDILRDTGVEPPRLCLELTETALIDDPDTAADTLTALRARGIAIAVDDFGTGQSSLTYLRRFPIEMVKVDRSFVGGLPTDPADTAIVGSVVDLGRRLGLTTLAEGVETEEQAEVLRGMGCELAQGFYFSRALPDAALVDWVSAR